MLKHHIICSLLLCSMFVIIGVAGNPLYAQDAAPTVRFSTKPPNIEEVYTGGAQIVIIAQVTGTDLTEYKWEPQGSGTFEKVSNTIAKYTPPITIDQESEMMIITLTVTDSQKRTAADTLVLTIVRPPLKEAEDCQNIQGCRSQGWIPWDNPDCSNGRCLANTSPSSPSTGVDATFSLPFHGKGLWIIYRQDVWYGALRVEIDGELITELSERGTAVVNKKKVCYEAEQESDHTLGITVLAPDVVTLDAFEILKPGQRCP